MPTKPNPLLENPGEETWPEDTGNGLRGWETDPCPVLSPCVPLEGKVGWDRQSKRHKGCDQQPRIQSE